jgi:hypothetical protein
VTPGGVISTVAGNGTSGFSGDGGPATLAQLNAPTGVAVDAAGNLYIADQVNNRVRRVTADGVMNTFAGSGPFGGFGGFSGDGGPATLAQLNLPMGVALDSAGNLYIAEARSNRVRKVSADGIISTVAGNGTSGFGGDGGSATSATLNNPTGVAVDAAGNLYIVEQNNHRVRRVALSGVISTVVGSGTFGSSGAGGFTGDGGSATSAQLNIPSGIALDRLGNLYIADYFNSRIRVVTPGGMINTIVGSGPCCGFGGFGGDGGPATSAQLKYPFGIALDATGDNLFIADTGNNRVRKVNIVK